MKRTLADRVRTANDALLVAGDTAAIAEHFSPDFVAHIGGRDYRGHRFVKRYVNEIRRSFTNLRVDINVLMSRGDSVAWQRTLRGKHETAFKGFPATGRSLTWHDMIVTRFDGTLIAEDWAVSDLAEQLLAVRHK